MQPYRLLKGEKVMGSHHQPQTVVVVPVVWIVVVAIRRGGVILIVVEGTAPQHLPGSLTAARRAESITRRGEPMYSPVYLSPVFCGARGHSPAPTSLS